MRISLFIVSMLVVSLAVTGFIVYFAGFNAAYGTSYDASENLSEFNQAQDLSNITSQLSTQIKQQQQSTGGFNVIGDFLSYGWNSVKIIFSSTDTFYKILNAGFKAIPGDDPFGAITEYRYVIGAIVIVVFVFALIAILSGRTNL
jgi:hypothetical protein